MDNYKQRKILTMSVVVELTDMTERKIRYYEERKLIFPDRTAGGTRRYSLADVEKIIEIGRKVTSGIQTFQIKQEEKQKQKTEDIRRKMLQGQINATFGKNTPNNKW